MQNFTLWLENNSFKFYHGSDKKMPVGTILIPQPNYEERWGNTDFYHILESYRPKHMISHKNAIFMCDNMEDIDNAGGYIDYIYLVQPLGKVEKHDMNWSSEISALDPDEIDDIVNASRNYWNGLPHYNESLWEYLTPKAKILQLVETNI